MTPKSQSRPLTFQVTLTVLALAIFGLALVTAFGLFATMQADRASLEKQRIFVSNGVAEQIQAVRREQESVAVWDDSVTYAKAGDQQWMAENLGAWMYSYYGHDRVYVLDDHDNPVHAMRDGNTLEPGVFAEDGASILPAVTRLRRQLAQQAADPSDEADKPVVDDLVSLAGQPAILSVQPLVPSSDRVSQEPGTEYLHVSVQFIDDALVGKIAAQYLLSFAQVLPRLASKVTGATVPLIDSRGVILGYIGWEQDRPGMSLVRKAAPALVGAVLLSIGVLAYLLRRLRRASGQLQQSQDKAQYLAFHDTLTGLPNRALFEDRLNRALVTASRDKSRVALLYLDLNRFKHVNDTLGHPAGDDLVRQAASRLERSIREIDTVARLGGDEFAVILVGIKDARSAEDLCDALLRQFNTPFQLADDQVFIGASIGIAISDKEADPADLLRKADIALYEAKKNGRGRYQVFAGDMDDILLRKRRIESELRAALMGGDEIRMTYQPVYAADCETVVGAEALIRWNHPVHGALPPAQFVAIAEERGMIGLLGDRVLKEAISFAAASDLPWVAVNVSPLQLRDESFTQKLLAMLDETGLPASRLQLEITESVLLENNDTTRTALAGLRSAGILIALDDFGTGYSSINYLRRHAIDKLKIDRSFVRALDEDENSVAIVKALIDVARAVNVQVTAEGVETEKQKKRLVAMGCHQLQGYLLSPPLEPAQLLAQSEITEKPLLGFSAG